MKNMYIVTFFIPTNLFLAGSILRIYNFCKFKEKQATRA